jgi:hypothetical protein
LGKLCARSDIGKGYLDVFSFGGKVYALLTKGYKLGTSKASANHCAKVSETLGRLL